MSRADDCIKGFEEFLVDILRTNVEVNKLDVAKFADKLRVNAFKKMIADTEKTLCKITDNPDMDIQEKIKSLSVIMLNASIVDIDDMKHLTQEEAKSYLDMIRTVRNRFNLIMLNIITSIYNMKNELAHPKEEDEDLTKLSRRELIERLRRK